MINDCRLCGEGGQLTKVEEIATPPTMLYECALCKGQFWWPVANLGAGWYEQTYASRNDEPTQKLGWNHNCFLRENITPSTLLDVGCGIGHFLAAAQNQGWQVWGLDFDQNAVRVAREYFKIDTVDQVNVEAYISRFPNRRFKAITAFEVLEHMEEPKAFIRAIGSLLEPNGYVAISVPYRNSPVWLRPHDFPPRHLTRWSRTSISNFLNNHGFKVIHCWLGPVTLERILMRIKFSAGRLGSANLVSRVQKKDKITKAQSTYSSNKVRWLRRLARLKDWLLFGLPTLGYWNWLWLTNRQYLTLYVLAQESDEKT